MSSLEPAHPSQIPSRASTPDVEKQAAEADSSASSSAGSIIDEKVDTPVAQQQVEPPKEIEATLPPKKGRSSLTRWLDLIFFSYYRKTFTIIFFANLAVFIAIVVRAGGRPMAQDVGSAASANLMVTLLFRQENFVNLVYEIAVACPHSAPLWLRSRLAKVFHYGGAHSGAGTAAVVWYILYTALVTQDYLANRSPAGLANTITSYILVTMFCLILAGAYPRFRVLYHDYFEAIHRYSGWVAVCTFWTHTIFAANQYRVLEPDVKPLGIYLINTPNFWTLCISTSCTLLSWGRLRRIDVYPEVLSSHAIRLHFKYRQMKPFYGLKVSSRPLLEWHAFATIPDEDANGNPDGFSVLISNAGDWTRETITNPPKKLWVRGAPLHGLLYTSMLFKRIVVVATGSGIGPTLSLFHADVTPRRIFWSTPAPETTYGENVLNAVRKADPNARVWDTRKEGRPDMVIETWKLVKESNAEAVFIISNPKMTRKVVFGMESRGVPAYGAIFDS
ncbi:nrps-like [Moniliophthora roreri]|nr:nrps-like [Moniliophthora roreri]